MTFTTESPEGGEPNGLNQLSGSIIGSAIEVHRQLGPGLSESAYQACLEYEPRLHGHRVEAQKSLSVVYRGMPIDCLYRLDMIVDGQVLVEIKAVEALLPVHQAQTLSYLRLSGLPLGLLVNFHGATLKEGVRRYRNSQPSSSLSVFSAPLR